MSEGAAKHRSNKTLIFFLAIGLAVLTASPVAQSAPKKDKPTEEVYEYAGSGTVTFDREVTMAQLEALDAAAPAPAAVDTEYNLPQDWREYEKQKAAANLAKERFLAGQNAPAVNEAAENAPPDVYVKAYDGFRQQEAGCIPPDTDGTVGAMHYVQVVNCRVAIYRKSDDVKVRDVSLQTFFGETDFTFDPRAVYDQTFKRYVALATRAADSPTDPSRRMRLAVTNASNGDAAQRWLMYSIWWSGPDGEWCDFPQLGLSQDSILITCNNFVLGPNGNSFNRTLVFAVPKARVYNGWGFSFGYFSPADSWSIAPPVVAGTPIQPTDELFFIEANDASDLVELYRMEKGAHSGETTFVKQANIPVPAWFFPPDAYNGPDGPFIDTMDGRFQQNSWQNGNSLWNMHTERSVSGGIAYARPRYYQINTATNAIDRTGIVQTSSDSDEWNGSLAVNPANQVFMTWTRTTSAIYPQIRRGGCEVSAGDCDAVLDGPNSILHIGSNNYISNFIGDDPRNRWGDYSSVEPDPSNYGPGCTANKRAWATNEFVRSDSPTDHAWDSRIILFGFC